MFCHLAEAHLPRRKSAFGSGGCAALGAGEASQSSFSSHEHSALPSQTRLGDILPLLLLFRKTHELFVGPVRGVLFLFAAGITVIQV